VKGQAHGYVGVLVEDDLEEVRRQNGRGFESLLGLEDVLLLSVRSRRGAGQIWVVRAVRKKQTK